MLLLVKRGYFRLRLFEEAAWKRTYGWNMRFQDFFFLADLSYKVFVKLDLSSNFKLIDLDKAISAFLQLIHNVSSKYLGLIAG
jgi:hypothetical protein